MVLVVKMLCLSFQLNNGKNLSNKEVESLKSDPKMGSHREIFNNRVQTIPTYFEFVNFNLALF